MEQTGKASQCHVERHARAHDVLTLPRVDSTRSMCLSPILPRSLGEDDSEIGALSCECGLQRYLCTPGSHGEFT